MQVGLVYGRVREEERLLLAAAERLGIDVVPQRDEELRLSMEGGVRGDVVLCRSISTTRGLYVLRACDTWGIPTVNPLGTAQVCMDKADTSWRLHRAGVPTPETRVSFGEQAALQALEELGYPAVIKPVQGSWARLVARVDDAREAAQLLEHRAMLPNPLQHVYYLQAYVDKRNGAGHRDLRAFVVGDETIAAVWRTSPDWITNTARGATTEAARVDDDLNDLCLRAADAVGGGVLAVDLMPGPDGLVVHEVNHTMEFRNSIAPTGVDIPAAILEYAVTEGRR